MSGPMTYDQWEACWLVYRTVMVMLEYASPSALDSNRDNLRQFAVHYSTQCWAVVYQTRTRARRELAERLRRRHQ